MKKIITHFLSLALISSQANEITRFQNTISFKENKGQLSDQNLKPRPDVLFSGTDGEMAFHLRNNGISYQLYRIDSWKRRSNA